MRIMEMAYQLIDLINSTGGECHFSLLPKNVYLPAMVKAPNNEGYHIENQEKSYSSQCGLVVLEC